jgi:outer membrane protein TolC
MRILTAFGFIASLLAVAGPSPAEEPGGPPPLEGEAAPGAPAPLQGELALSVQDAIVLTVENNLDVEIARYEPLISDLDHTSAWGAYDPNAFASFGHSSIDTPVASTFEPSALVVERDTIGKAGVVGLIPRLGGQYEISYGGERFTTTQAIPNLSPEYRASVLGSLTVPLLKGAWWGAPWVLIRQTGIGAEISHEDFRKNLMDLLQATENAYWSVSASGEKRRVSQKSLEASQALLDQTKAQYEVGVVSRVEVTEAEAGLAQREVDVIVAENGYRRTQDQLIDLVLGPNLTPDSSLDSGRPTRPGDRHLRWIGRPTARLVLARDRSAAERRAPEVSKGRKNQRLPVDLKLSYSWQLGLTNPSCTRGCPSVHTFSRPRRLLRQRRREPVVRRSGRHHPHRQRERPGGREQGGARASTRAHAGPAARARHRHRGARGDPQPRVRPGGHRGRGAAPGSRGGAAPPGIRSSSESTPFDVLQREEDLVDAESQKILALQLYHTSITALDRAQGTILDNRNIVVEEAAALR